MTHRIFLFVTSALTSSSQFAEVPGIRDDRNDGRLFSSMSTDLPIILAVFDASVIRILRILRAVGPGIEAHRRTRCVGQRAKKRGWKTCDFAEPEIAVAIIACKIVLHLTVILAL